MRERRVEEPLGVLSGAGSGDVGEDRQRGVRGEPEVRLAEAVGGAGAVARKHADRPDTGVACERLERIPDRVVSALWRDVRVNTESHAREDPEGARATHAANQRLQPLVQRLHAFRAPRRVADEQRAGGVEVGEVREVVVRAGADRELGVEDSHRPQCRARGAQRHASAETQASA